LSATWKIPRSQFVPPPALRPSMKPFTVSAPACVETGVTGRFWLLVVLAGAVLAKVNSASWDGVPTSEFVKGLAADFSDVREPATEPERSSTRATLSPQVAGRLGLLRDDCQMPPDATALLLPVASMNVAFGPDDA